MLTLVDKLSYAWSTVVVMWSCLVVLECSHPTAQWYVPFPYVDFKINENATFEVRDGWTSLSPLIFSANSTQNDFESVMSTGRFLQIRWFGQSDNTSNIHMYYSSIHQLGKYGYILFTVWRPQLQFPSPFLTSSFCLRILMLMLYILR